jgi:hypothetical protein
MKNKISKNSAEAAEQLNRPIGVKSGLKRFSTACRAKFNALKSAITANLAEEFAGVLRLETTRQVVNEADALAASTPFPALFLPALAEEKVVFATRWQNKQRRNYDHSLPLAA